MYILIKYFRVETHLGVDTAVNVTLRGNHTEIETPYTARLIAVYSDGGNRARQIHGIRSEVKLLDVTPDFGPVFFTGKTYILLSRREDGKSE